ncbi:glycoside hydrolase family 27 protein [Streptomyces sp. NPDC020362]|uniref:glycoside hydrolase family 27 protein n=1 Tax=unclassified Streptomyces TaxID=2593676 RepID=UPI000A568696
MRHRPSTQGRIGAARSALALATACVLATVGVQIASPAPAAALDNGLGLTPQMGWNSWNAYRCNIDEDKIKSAADHLEDSGLKDAGYKYVNIDDCWQRPTRDADGRLVADPVRFSHGIKALADYIHGKGLKLGIYTTPGSRSCANIWDGETRDPEDPGQPRRHRD